MVVEERRWQGWQREEQRGCRAMRSREGGANDGAAAAPSPLSLCIFFIDQDLNKVKSKEGDSRWQELAAARSDKQLRQRWLWICGKM